MTQHTVTTPARQWTVEAFRTFWAAPTISFIPTIRQVVNDDIVGHWPRPIGDIADPDLYLGVIADIHDLSRLEIGGAGNCPIGQPSLYSPDCNGH